MSGEIFYEGTGQRASDRTAVSRIIKYVHGLSPLLVLVGGMMFALGFFRGAWTPGRQQDMIMARVETLENNQITLARYARFLIADRCLDVSAPVRDLQVAGIDCSEILRGATFRGTNPLAAPPVP